MSREGIELLVKRYGFRLLGVAISQLRDRTTAEEVVQDVLWSAHGQLARGRPVTWAWLAQRTIWRTRQARRRAWRREVPMAQMPPGVGREGGFAAAELLEAVQSLSPKLSEALMLHHWAGFSLEEVAAMLQVPIGTVKSRLSRGRAALAALLPDWSAE